MNLSSIAVNDGLTIEADAPLPTRHGNFHVYVFRHASEPNKEHVAIVAGDVAGKQDVPVRLHSECLTSEVIGSLKCDCREQLENALDHIGRTGVGVVLYLRQEGRDIGLANKIRAYALQARGVDTVDANRELGLPDDARRYHQSAAMLRALGVASIKLMTNNPLKLEALRAMGVPVVGRIPVLISPNQHSRGYLEAKRVRMNHALPSWLTAPPATNSDAE